MRKLLIFVLLHIVSLFAYAQYTPILPVKLPELLPPTPDVAALIKVGMGSVNFSTGAVTASIPIYKMQLGAFSLPISLDYSSQGTKVLEPCTRVGANWMLNAAGVVSRSVVGRPDELASRPAMPSDLSAINIDNYNYFKQSANLDPTSTFDTQPDEFRFNFNGESGKFVLDQNRNAVINAHSNLMINVSVLGDEISEIIITTTDGTKYYFGADGAYETTISVVNMMFRQSIKTAFYLTKIELLSGDKIDFYYSSLNTKVSLGNVTTMVVGADGEGSQCTPIGSELSYTTKSQEVEYRTCRLNSIVASNGQRAIFGYENRNDASNEVVLKNISVATTVNTIKFYKLFHYTESVFGSGQNGRFYLTKLRQLDTQPGFNENDENNPRQEYNFEYEDMEHHVTDGQDHWGFANGSGSGVSFQHPTYGSSSIVVVGGAPNSQYSKKGVLKKIIYPTGGIEEFKCEGNTLSVEEKVNTTYSLYIEGRGQAGNTFSNPGKLYYGTVEPLRNQVIKVLISAIFDPASPGPSHPGDNTKTMFVTATDITTGDIKMNDYILGTQTLDLTLSVTAGHEYVFKMEVRGGDYMLGRTVITYDTSSRDYYKWVEKEAGGVRVSKILKTDPVTGKVVKKCYTYRSLDDTLRSSGEGSLTVSYHSRTCNAYYVQSGLGETRYLCYSDVYSSNSVFNLIRYDNSHMPIKQS